jgi:hypothetical protein
MKNSSKQDGRPRAHAYTTLGNASSRAIRKAILTPSSATSPSRHRSQIVEHVAPSHLPTLQRARNRLLTTPSRDFLYDFGDQSTTYMDKRRAPPTRYRITKFGSIARHFPLSSRRLKKAAHSRASSKWPHFPSRNSI